MPQYPWEDSYPSGVCWDQALVATPVENLLDLAATKWPHKTAVSFSGCRMTFRDLHELARCAAKGFQSLGVGPNVQVALHLVNSPHYLVCFFGILMAGGRVVNLNPHASRREVEYQLSDSEAQAVVTLASPPYLSKIEALKGTGTLNTVVVCRTDDFSAGAPRVNSAGMSATNLPQGEVEFLQLINNDGAYRPWPHGRLEDEVAILQYTGGTTGDPKAAMLTHSNLSAVPQIIRPWVGDLIGDNSTLLLVLPLSHIFGLVVMLLSVASGTAILLHTGFDPDQVLRDVARRRVNIFFGVPTMYVALVQHAGINDFDLSSLKLCGSGGAPLPVSVQSQFKKLTGTPVLEGYSLTEITDLGTWQPIGPEPRARTVGLPLPRTLVEVVDVETSLQVLPIGERGEICFSGPQLMKGYWKKPEATAEAFRGGRFHSGDIGLIDREGYVTLVDRKKEMLLCGGYNVFPRKIEKVLCEHPAVADAAVIGVSDPELGQLPKAVLALKPGHGPLTLRQLQAFLRDKLASYEIPLEMELRPSLPRTSVGKVSKQELLAEESADRANRHDH